jgi:hypothetical protein
MKEGSARNRSTRRHNENKQSIERKAMSNEHEKHERSESHSPRTSPYNERHTDRFTPAASRLLASHCGIFACIALKILSASAVWSIALNNSASIPLARSENISHCVVLVTSPLKDPKTSVAEEGRLGRGRDAMRVVGGLEGLEGEAVWVSSLKEEVSVSGEAVLFRAYHGFRSVSEGDAGLGK